MYLVLKLLHIAAVIVFLGNIVTGRFWHGHAVRTRDPKLLAHMKWNLWGGLAIATPVLGLALMVLKPSL